MAYAVFCEMYIYDVLIFYFPSHFSVRHIFYDIMSLSSRKSSTSLRERLEMLVICPICLEQFKDPKVFPCLHSYCYKCIVKLAENSQSTQTSLICPECRATVEVRYRVFFIYLCTVYRAGS